MRYRSALMALAVSFLSGCITPPAPCTTEWAEDRAGIVLARFATENRGLIEEIRLVVRKDGRIDPVRTAMLAGRTQDIRRLARSFDTVLVPELEQIARECATQERLAPAFLDFLEKEGVPEQALDWVDAIISLTGAGRNDLRPDLGGTG